MATADVNTVRPAASDTETDTAAPTPPVEEDPAVLVIDEGLPPNWNYL